MYCNVYVLIIILTWVGREYSTLCMYLLTAKSKQATSHKLGNLRQEVVFCKADKFFQAIVAQIAFKFKKQEN